MASPNNPDRYYVLTESQVRDGVHGKVKIKKWTDDDGKDHAEELNWEPERRVEISKEEQNKCLERLKNLESPNQG